MRFCLHPRTTAGQVVSIATGSKVPSIKRVTDHAARVTPVIMRIAGDRQTL